MVPLITVENNKISITSGRASLRIDGKSYDGQGAIRLVLYPRPHLKLTGRFPTHTPIRLDINPEFAIEGQVFNASINSCSFKDAHSEIGFIQEPIILKQKETSLHRVVFHLLNFLEFNGGRCTIEEILNGNSKMTHRINHLDFEWLDWKIEIKSLVSTSAAFKKLKEEGGYEITHVGEITRLEGKSFTAGEAQERVAELGKFLSFAKGTFCNPVGVIGFDAEGARTWEYWTSPHEPWALPLSWFETQGTQLIGLYPAFMEKWSSPRWRQTFTEVLSLRLNANSNIFLESRITLTQIALEKLACEYLVHNQEIISWRKFNRNSADRNFRKLFTSLKIPLTLPSHYKHLIVLQQDLEKKECERQRKETEPDPRPVDTCSVLTLVRNFISHPQREQSELIRRSYFEAWTLGGWYLELCILAICGYSERYSNRLILDRCRGEAENVPWKENLQSDSIGGIPKK